MTIQDFPEFTLQERIRYIETTPDGTAKLSSIAVWFQEAAATHAKNLGFGENTLAQFDVAWVLTRIVLYVKRLPSVGETVAVRTWPSSYKHIWHRGYELKDMDGNVLIQSSGAWTLMNLTTRRLAPMPESLTSLYPQQTLPVLPFLQNNLPRIQNIEHSIPLLVRRDDLDRNGHVNNTRYISWLTEVLQELPRQFTLDVQFRAETLPEQKLDISCSSLDHANMPSRVFSITRTESSEKTTEICRALMRYNLE